VPIRATEEYKKAAIEAAAKAGLKVTALVKEPVASLLSFGIGQTPELVCPFFSLFFFSSFG